MGRSKVDIQELKAFRDRLDKAAKQTQLTAFYEQAAKELAARLLALAKKRTPVVSGNLRRGWTATEVRKVDGGYQIEVINPAEYASYVEFGHRQTPGRYVPAIGKRLKANWVKGRFMLTISEQELETMAPQILEKKLQKFLEGVVTGSDQ